MLGIDVHIMDYDSEFYRLNHRSGELARVEEAILRGVERFTFDYIFTHNPHGEYGHLDHKFVSNLLFRTAPCPLLITDITLIADWTHMEPTSARYATTFYRNLLETTEVNEAFYRKIMEFYKTRGVWTWSKEPNRAANVYEI